MITAQTVDVQRNVDWTILELCALVVVTTPALLTVLSLATVSNSTFATLYGDERYDRRGGKKDRYRTDRGRRQEFNGITT